MARPLSYATHRRNDPVMFYFIFPVFTAATITAAVCFLCRFSRGAYPFPWLPLGLTIVGIAAMTLAWHTRTYAVTLQDRIIRTEQMLRFLRFFPGRIDDIHRVTTGQYIALRFAADDEAKALFEEAVRNPAMTKDEIKRRITQWIPDELRV